MRGEATFRSSDRWHEGGPSQKLISLGRLGAGVGRKRRRATFQSDDEYEFAGHRALSRSSLASSRPSVRLRSIEGEPRSKHSARFTNPSSSRDCGSWSVATPLSRGPESLALTHAQGAHLEQGTAGLAESQFQCRRGTLALTPAPQCP